MIVHIKRHCNVFSTWLSDPWPMEMCVTSGSRLVLSESRVDTEGMLYVPALSHIPLKCVLFRTR